MNNFLLKIKQEWERSLLITVGLLLLAGLGWFGYSMFSEEGGSTSQSHALPAVPDYIDTKNFTFVQPPELQKNVNPMAFRKRLPRAFITPPTPPRPSGGTPGRTAPDPPRPGTTPTVSPPDGKQGGQTPTPPATQPDRPVKPSPPRKFIVQYRGMYKGLTERELAFITASDSKSKKTLPFYLETGQKVHNALAVKDFSPDAVILDCGQGREVTIPIGTKKEIILE